MGDDSSVIDLWIWCRGRYGDAAFGDSSPLILDIVSPSWIVYRVGSSSVEDCRMTRRTTEFKVAAASLVRRLGCAPSLSHASEAGWAPVSVANSRCVNSEVGWKHY